VHYPEHGVTTANEIHIPAGQSIEVRLRAEGIIHSFWVPRLHGKMDMVPGRTNSIWLHADEPGVYRGQCAEFCGVQHTKMAFLVVAQSPGDFDQWVANQRRAATDTLPAQAQAGRALFMALSCRTCHTIRGTEAAGRLGPDLTHVGSRRTLAAATVDNSPENLARWIREPDTIKPGSQMPATQRSPEEIQAIAAYLASLD
jgi:cytochrome c oxidase subunit 2